MWTKERPALCGYYWFRGLGWSEHVVSVVNTPECGLWVMKQQSSGEDELWLAVADIAEGAEWQYVMPPLVSIDTPPRDCVLVVPSNYFRYQNSLLEIVTIPDDYLFNAQVSNAELRFLTRFFYQHATGRMVLSSYTRLMADPKNMADKNLYVSADLPEFREVYDVCKRFNINIHPFTLQSFE